MSILSRFTRLSRVAMVPLIRRTGPSLVSPSLRASIATCPVVSRQKNLAFPELVEQVKQDARIQELEAKDLMGLLDPNHKDSSQPKTVILDVRETPEHATGRIPTSLPIPRGVLEGTVDSIGLDRSTPLVIYCAGGFRSVLAAETLQRMGFTRVQSLRGGMKAWREAGGPVTQGTGQE